MDPLPAAASSLPSPVRTCAVPRMSAAAAGAPTSAIATMNARARIHRHDRDMRAMVLDRPGSPLREAALPEPTPGPGQLVVKVQTCGVRRPPPPHPPLVPGPQIVGTVVGEDRRVGIPWLGWTDGKCRFCRSGRENLCDNARFTGYDLDGGEAGDTVADGRFCVPLPERYYGLEAAPLLCAGLIGYRSLRFTGDGERLGLYGFGAAPALTPHVARPQRTPAVRL